MNQKSETLDHLFIKNPYTGKLINVLPLLEMMAEDRYTKAGPADLALRIQEVHDYVSTHMPVSPGSVLDGPKWVDMNYTLIEFRKTFERMAEVKP